MTANIKKSLLFISGLVAVAAVLILPTTSALASPIVFVTDNKVVGTTYILTSFDFGTLTLGGQNDKGTFTSTLVAKTVFRDAKLDKYSPGDPYNEACKSFADNYNVAGVNSDSVALFTALSDMASNHCAAKVLIDSKTSSIKSLRPIAFSSDPY